MALTINLNGNNYVSEKRRQAFETVLEDGAHITTNGNGNGHTPTEQAHATACAEPQSSTQAQTTHAGSQSGATADYERAMESAERGLARAFDHQQQTLHTHEHYLDCQADYAKIFAQVMEQQGTIFTAGSATPQQAATAAQVLESLARSVARFHDIQAETLNIHKQFLDQQGEYTRATVELLQTQHNALVPGNGNGNGHHPIPTPHSASPAIPTPVAQPAPLPLPAVVAAPVRVASPAPGDGGGEQVLGDGGGEQSPAPPPRLPSTVYRLPPATLTHSLLDIVSEKTGYPAEMLDLTMDMEADLGIDSIKRVEILGALQDLHPDLPEFSADALAELRTLGQIVEYMATQTHAASPATGDEGGEQVSSPSPPSRLPSTVYQ